MVKRSRLSRSGGKVRKSRLDRQGVIEEVRGVGGSVWQMVVKTDSGKRVLISGDARMLGGSLMDVYGSPSGAKGHRIRFTPDPVFGASAWEPEDMGDV